MVQILFKKKSIIHGTGVFASRDIKQGIIFYKIPMKNIFNAPQSNCAHIGKNLWVSDEEVLNYVNHSCDANARLDILDKPLLLAKRDIHKNEEITVDYNETEKDGKNVPCTCKTKNCKKYFLRIE